MARDRQRAKQRQAERQAARRARRLAEEPAVAPAEALPGRPGTDDGERVTEAEAEQIDLAASAPPANVGRSDTVADAPPPAPDLDDEGGSSPTPGREEEQAPQRRRGKVLGFLAASWAELQRVQWPDRAAVTSLTGVVLGFVILAGGYLGLLDAIFAKLVQAIL